jgi:hypothetical protein
VRQNNLFIDYYLWACVSVKPHGLTNNRETNLKNPFNGGGYYTLYKLIYSCDSIVINIFGVIVYCYFD